jgi:Mg-chelatase subunit ChlD
MVLAVSRIRTSLVIGAAFGTVIVALWIRPREPMDVHTTTNPDDGVQISARFPTSRMLPGAQDNNLAVTITAPHVKAALSRPPLALAIVIDRSGSMHGAPLDHAKAAALAMVRQLELDERDTFAVVTHTRHLDLDGRCRARR